MKATKLYTRVAFALIMLCNHLNVLSQKLEFLDANNINAGIGTGGNLFTMRRDTQWVVFPDTSIKWNLFEVPKGSRKRMDYNSALDLAALDEDSVLHGFFSAYNERGVDCFDGPIVADYSVGNYQFFKQVFKVTQAQLQRHLALSFPTSASNIDTAFLKWPGKGNPFILAQQGIDITSRLAPFFDANGDGIYDPTIGDYPEFCGEQAIFFVFNDDRRTHTESNCAKLGMEIRGLAEEFVSANPSGKSAIDNTVFVHYEIENKSGIHYPQFNLGKFEDPDVGCFNNDRIGCDTLRNLMFAYNATSPDPDCNNEYGYGATNAAFGVKFLNNHMSVFSYATYGTPGEIDTAHYVACEDLRFHLNGFWSNGTPYTYGGDGWGGSVAVKYLFPGNPADPNSWSEEAQGALAPGDRKMNGCVGPIDFGAHETKSFDFAFFAAYDTAGTRLTIVDSLKQDADLVQQFYNAHYANCHQFVGLSALSDALVDVHVFPVPTKQLLKVLSSWPIESIELFDLTGRSVVMQMINAKATDLMLPALANGAYLLKVSTKGGMVFKKVVIE